MQEHDDYADDRDTPPVRYPWQALVGLALPYSASAFGWWVADRVAAGPRRDAWWDTAGAWVHAGVFAAVLAAGWCCLPVFRRVRHPGHLVLAVVAVVAYFVLLLLFNLHMYMQTSGPFP